MTTLRRFSLDWPMTRPGSRSLPSACATSRSSVLSREGLTIIKAQKDTAEGYVPLSPSDLALERAKLKCCNPAGSGFSAKEHIREKSLPLEGMCSFFEGRT